MGTSGGRGRRASRSAGALDDGDEEEDGERILVCTVCEEDVVKVKVRVGEGGKVVGTEEILEILCEKRVSRELGSRTIKLGRGSGCVANDIHA